MALEIEARSGPAGARKEPPRAGQAMKQPLRPEERRRVLDAAKRLRRENVNAYRVIAFLMYTGAHPFILHNRARAMPRIDGNTICWLRPKKRGAAAETRVPIADEIKPWIEEFFVKDLPALPTWRQFYWNLCNEVGKKAGVDHLSPMTLRHTFGVMLDDMGLSPSDIQTMMNASVEDATKRYAKRQWGEVADKMRRGGF